MSLTNQSVLEALHEITAPGSSQSLVEAGTIRDLEIDGSSVRLALAVQVVQPSDVEELRTRIETCLLYTSDAADDLLQV